MVEVDLALVAGVWCPTGGIKGLKSLSVHLLPDLVCSLGLVTSMHCLIDLINDYI